MRFCFTSILLLLTSASFAQTPPRVAWQRSLGGTFLEFAQDMITTTDGGSILCGQAGSSNGDVVGHHGNGDVWVVKLDNNGNIQWSRCYGGSRVDYANTILQTADGGYIFAGFTSSNNGDVTFNHSAQTDVWVVRINSTGNIIWQKTYGGTSGDQGFDISPTSDGGFLVTATSKSTDGDVTGYHHDPADPLFHDDAWLFRIDGLGNLLWQKCLGGNKGELLPRALELTNGDIFFAATTLSNDGDVSCVESEEGKIWMMGLDWLGNIQWNKCWGAKEGQYMMDLVKDADENIVMVGNAYAFIGRDGYGFGDAFLLKVDSDGTPIWQKWYGGTKWDEARDVSVDTDGGYVIMGITESSDVDLCVNYGYVDAWIVKVDINGNRIWQRTYGGTLGDYGAAVTPAPGGGYYTFSNTTSNDIDVSGNHGEMDWWATKLEFPGDEVYPIVTISTDENVLCPGKENVRFTAASVDGGTLPQYQWQINGINTATNEDTVYLVGLQQGDQVTCILTSNSHCITIPTDTSNIIPISIDPSLSPASFFARDKDSICIYGKLALSPSIAYNKYLWSTGDITYEIIASQPGEYWLRVIDSKGCPGRDTMHLYAKECLRGFYMPTGFTPNGDGRNDVLRPIVAGVISRYKFRVYNRWGQLVFETDNTMKGWDGTFQGKVQNNDVFVWTCIYQFEGEELKQEKGTVVIIR